MKIIYSLTVKASLIFENDYGFKNRKSFSRFKLFIILACTFVGIRHLRALELLVAWIYHRRSPNFGIRLPEYGDHRWNLATRF
jgi:hypothetical protein